MNVRWCFNLYFEFRQLVSLHFHLENFFVTLTCTDMTYSPTHETQKMLGQENHHKNSDVTDALREYFFGGGGMSNFLHAVEKFHSVISFC